MRRRIILPAALLVTLTKAASAQEDVNRPLPDVLLLVDTSGSMEFDTSGNRIACGQVDPTLSTETRGTAGKSRWIQLVEVLTGDIVNYDCYTQDRRSLAFRQEFQLGSSFVDPYDFAYYIPFHRILSNSTCAVGPGTQDVTTPFAWTSNDFTYHPWNDRTGSCTFEQTTTGVLDAFRDTMRFGLMTFDTQPDSGVGLSGTQANYATGAHGTWSYYSGWRAGTAGAAQGRPAGCTTSAEMEVGARNAAAPPWEGRMIPFGSPTASQGALYATNEHIQQTIRAIRPFGATPIDAMFTDAREFFVSDDTADPNSGSSTCTSGQYEGCFGPRFDPYVTQGCRDRFIVLLTDGEPNLDLRPSCEGTGGQCPYPKKAAEIAYDLAHPADGRNAIKTFVIGFAVSTQSSAGGGTSAPIPVDCSNISTRTIDASGNIVDTFDPAGRCASNDPSLAACCTLAKIAYNGGTLNATFANSATDLRAAVAQALNAAAASTTSRTLPVFGSAASSGASGSYSFLSSFIVQSQTMWKGVLERRRTICQKSDPNSNFVEPVDQPIDPAKGDDFAANLNQIDATNPRRYYTVIGALDADARHSERSIRPAISTLGTNVDGAGTYGGTTVTGTNSSFFYPLIDARAMQVPATPCARIGSTTADDCALHIMKWEIGAPDGTNPARKNADGSLNLFADIYHATPVLHGAPGEVLRDDSYSTFATAQRNRPLVLYTATNDGQLHAFKVASAPGDTSDSLKVDKLANNELWSFFPPAVLPRIASQYPYTHQVLLDGTPVVKDVVFRRTAADAKAGQGTWNTVLVAGFGSGAGGYFALDVTNPTVAAGGPKFLWQLTTDAAGRSLFGVRGAKPAIATLFFDPANGDSPAEHAVAILPGGDINGDASTTQTTLTAPEADSYKPRTRIRQWPDDPARSITIVLLETGEIVRTFRSQAVGPSSIAARALSDTSSYTNLPAPMTGQPVVYPAATGVVADRAFIGDREGLLYRLDLSATKPSAWRADLWFDTFNQTVGNFVEGQPIATPPILSVARDGAVTVAVSTGDQETFGYSASAKNFLWSLAENAAVGSSAEVTFKPRVLWYSSFDYGERVSGPMQLFNAVLYYTTFIPVAPNNLNKCDIGSSKLCGVSYVQPASGGTSGGGGQAALSSSSSGSTPVQCIALGTNSIAFGPGIMQKPVCSDETTNYADPYLGLGPQVGFARASGGGFSLVVQAGPGGAAVAGAKTRTITMPLQPPLSAARIDSWAAVVE